jgi:type II secretory pathway pseudopilin PulG
MKTPTDRNKTYRSQCAARCTVQRRVGFTLVEMMVALVIMMLLFGIIFVPLSQAFNFFQLGQTRTNMQQAARQTLEQLSSDIRTAVRVFPNDITPGITNQPPYNNNGGPYINATTCGDPDDRVSNLSRLDFIPAQVDRDGTVITPTKPARYLVTYYARRLTIDPADAEKSRYDAVTNPVVLFRAQSPILDGNDNPAEEPNSAERNVDTSGDRYTTGSCDNRGSSWLMQQRGRT